jgi:hypothetical protein
MEKEPLNLRVAIIRAKLERSWIVAARLMDDLDHSTLTNEERCDATRHWQEVTHEGDLLALALDLMRRQQKESFGHENRIPKSRA